MLNYSRFQHLNNHHLALQTIRTVTNLKNPYLKAVFKNDNVVLNNIIQTNAKKIIYNSVIESKKISISNKFTNKKVARKNKFKDYLHNLPPKPLTSKYITCDIPTKGEDLDLSKNNVPSQELESSAKLDNSNYYPNKNENVQQNEDMMSNTSNWMTDYENYDEDISSKPYIVGEINYGTENPDVERSNVPCGGCGALLHCKDRTEPGYIPLEIFKNAKENGGANLQATLCQRCHFLKSYNLALQVKVSNEVYPKILATVAEKAGIVVLLVDLLDFPCSIWPGIADIFYQKRIIVVGNKADILPKDDQRYLARIKVTLLNNIKLCGFATSNIEEVILISAKTGYGVEELITRLQGLYRIKGDVYIVGCTNVGKSSLFNILIKSDFCKTQAIDLIPKATVSVWPGTTLNLLKFPIKRMVGYVQYLRHKRLQHKSQYEQNSNSLLEDHIDITKNPYAKASESLDYFNLSGSANDSGKTKMGINEKDPVYTYSRWCYDTPGVIQRDQITHLLNPDELSISLPNNVIQPRSFRLKPGSTIFIGGLARLDFLQADSSVILTLFCSNHLPITVCSLINAEEVYKNLLGTELFKVPCGNEQRFKKWPNLEPSKEIVITGKNWKTSSNDIVLSNAGWISVTGNHPNEYKFVGWTPEGRGICKRECLLPYAVNLKGKRLPYSVAYKIEK